MLLEFKVKNYKSYKDQVLFSMIASKSSKHEENLTNINNFNVLKSTILYGPTGSGKSNFIESLLFMKNFVLNSFSYIIGDKIKVNPSKLDGKSDSSFEIQFITENIRYAYGFSLNYNEIKEEYLYYFDKNNKKCIFERKFNEILINKDFEKMLEVPKSIIKDNKLFLSLAVNLGNEEFEEYKHLKNVFLFFKDKIVVYKDDLNSELICNIYNSLEKNHNLKNKLINYLNDLGFNIKNLINYEFNDKKYIIVDHFKYSLLLSEESKGFNKLLIIIYLIIDAIINKKIVIIDEMDYNLNENIIKEIIKSIHKANDGAQLIFSANNSNFLDLDLFRKDQIWFTKYDLANDTSILYSLLEFKNVQYNENIKESYLNGKFL